MEFDVSEKELELATEKFKKEMSKFPEDIQLGVSLGIEHLAFGCSWNFFTSLAQITQDENGKLIPPQDILLKMADLFDCEYGYLLGEECYKDGSKLNTAVCDFLGLSSSTVESLP